jgi:hypothetical protein
MHNKICSCENTTSVSVPLLGALLNKRISVTPHVHDNHFVGQYQVFFLDGSEKL